MRGSLQRWVEQLERQHHTAAKRVRYVWWDRREPEPEAAPGERLVVICWEEAEPPLPGSKE